MDRNSTFVYLLAQMKRLALLPIAKLKYGRKQIWLVCERGTDARDNGYHMFRYLRKEHPEIEAWYVITPDSPDLKKISDLGNIVFRGSLNHWMLYICAKRILTAFEPHYVPSGNIRFSRSVKKKNRQKIIFLQHGVIVNDIPIYYREQTDFDLFICGAKPEYDYISTHYHYTHGEARYTGLARYDALHDFHIKRQLLIMPTHRTWLHDMTNEQAAQSEFVQKWNRLLNHPRLAELAEKYDFTVVFYPHHLVQKYIHLFSSQNERVVIADFRNNDVQPLLKESALMITDYSSVHIDFAYMKKPLLYYQFDEKEVFEKHVGRGYLDYRKMGFGEVACQEDELLALIEEYMKGGCQVKPVYTQRIEGFFPLYDNHNCERIYNEIMTL